MCLVPGDALSSKNEECLSLVKDNELLNEENERQQTQLAELKTTENELKTKLETLESDQLQIDSEKDVVQNELVEQVCGGVKTKIKII